MSKAPSESSLHVAEPRPLHLLPRFVERIWGTHHLEPYFANRPGLIGEVWLTAEECLIEGSSLTLGEFAAQAPAQFGYSEGTGFPLLLKLLFPREKLSVQVHPDDALAQTMLGQPRGKTECWYVLAAEPGAQVAVGFREPVTPDGMRQAIADGSLESRLRMLDVQAGDMIFVDAGTVHAIGPGMVLLETQQYSDVTYRLWDYGRPRELHVEAGLHVLRTVTQAGRVAPTRLGDIERLLTCPYFAIDRFRLEAGEEAPLRCAGEMQILVALKAGATLRDPCAGSRDLPQAHAVLLPIGAAEYTLRAEHATEVIRILSTPAV